MDDERLNVEMKQSELNKNMMEAGYHVKACNAFFDKLQNI